MKERSDAIKYLMSVGPSKVIASNANELFERHGTGLLPVTTIITCGKHDPTCDDAIMAFKDMCQQELNHKRILQQHMEESENMDMEFFSNNTDHAQ